MAWIPPLSGRCSPESLPLPDNHESPASASGRTAPLGLGSLTTRTGTASSRCHRPPAAWRSRGAPPPPPGSGGWPRTQASCLGPPRGRWADTRGWRTHPGCRKGRGIGHPPVGSSWRRGVASHHRHTVRALTTRPRIGMTRSPGRHGRSATNPLPLRTRRTSSPHRAPSACLHSTGRVLSAATRRNLPEIHPAGDGRRPCFAFMEVTEAPACAGPPCLCACDPWAELA